MEKGEVDLNYVAWCKKRYCVKNEPELELERPAKTPYVQVLTRKSKKGWHGEKKKKHIKPRFTP